MKRFSYLLSWGLYAIAVLTFASCSEDTTQDVFSTRHGYVQFRVLKNGVERNLVSTRAEGDRLDSLSDARKIKVTLSGDGALIEQTMVLAAASDSLGEYGLRSEKLQLMAGEYRLLGYELYDNVDKRLLAGEPADEVVIRIAPGGLAVQDLEVNVIPRGLARFVLRSDLSQIQTRADSGRDYMLGEVAKVDVKVRNLTTGEVVNVEGVRTDIEYYYDESKGSEKGGYLTSRSICDTIIPLTAGNYRVTAYTVYDDNDRLLEANTDVAENGFVVKNNETVEANVPVTMKESAGHIKDGFTLKKIWEALDGPNWNYRGTSYAKGANWDFNRDVDLWTAQPGVQVLENGRVASLSLGGFGAKGKMPECLGDLTELRQLYLGTHLENSSDSPINGIDELYHKGGAEALHQHLLEYADPDYGLAAFPKEMRMTFTEEQRNRIKASETNRGWKAYNSGNDPENYATGITSLPQTIGRLRKLEVLYIADSPIMTIPDSVKYLENCTEVEIFHCPRMTEFPTAVVQMPSVIMLNMSFNTNLDGQSLYEGLKLMAGSPIGKSLQGLFLISNNLTAIPDLRGMAKLRTLSCQNNKIEKFEAPFGKDHIFAKLLMEGNKISSLPRDAEGYFVGFDSNVETISFKNNEFTELPDIFDAKSIYGLGTIDFSFNKISTIQHAAEGTYKGIRAEQLLLSYNRLPKFPACIYNSGSDIIYLAVGGNGMDGFEEGALKGDRIIATTTLDLSCNKLKEVPREFNNDTFPYLTALDMSYNSFDAYPWLVMNCANLNTFIFRGQRDAEGYRCMKEWPKGIYQHHGLRALLLGSNDIRKVDDTLSFMIQTLDISDNPNIVIDVSSLCPYIEAGLYYLMYDPSQDIRGCDALKLDR